MAGFKEYLLIQYKRIFKLLPGIIAMILIVAAILSAAGYALIYSETYSMERQRYKLGVVGNTDDEMISLGIQMISTLDESRYMIELIEYDDEAVARQAMRDAQISAYIVITEEFSDALNTMTNDSTLKYYASSGQKGISNVMMDEIASIATYIIVYSETGICTLRDLMKQEGFAKDIRSEKVNELFAIYMTALINRTNVVEMKELGLSDGLSTPVYYFLGILLFFMLLLSFCAISFFLGQKDARIRFMKSKGMGSLTQVVGEYLPFLTINVIAVAIILIIMGVAMSSGLIDMTQFDLDLMSEFSSICIHLLPVAIMFSALGFLIFEILVGVINKILVAFMLYIGMGYVSGYFYPKTFFPDTVQTVGEIIPSGMAFKYMGAVVQSQDSDKYLFVILAYTIIFLGAAVAVRQQKIR